MDLRRMNLIGASIQNVTSKSLEEYYLGAENMVIVDSMLDQFKDADLWDPMFQAWLPLFQTYLTYGCNPDKTLSYAGAILHKSNYLFPDEHPLSVMFSDILQLRGASDKDLFEPLMWGQIQEFCDVQCQFFIKNRKMIPTQLQNVHMYVSTITSLLDNGTWRGVMSALNLYRHCQLHDLTWPSNVVERLRGKISEWFSIYSETFEYIRGLIVTNTHYEWYCDQVYTVLERVWSTCLQTTDRPAVCTASDVYAMNPALADQVVNYVANCPAVFDNPFAQKTVWTSFCHLFFSPDSTAPAFILNSYFCLCVPKSYFLKMCNTLYDFYWCVKDERLPTLLYDRKVEGYQRSTGTKVTPQEYKSLLITRGFPFNRKE